MIDVPINEILESVAGAIGKFAKKINKFVHTGKIADFWEWVDKKWYRSDLHDERQD